VQQEIDVGVTTIAIILLLLLHLLTSRKPTYESDNSVCLSTQPTLAVWCHPLYLYTLYTHTCLSLSLNVFVVCPCLLSHHQGDTLTVGGVTALNNGAVGTMDMNVCIGR